MAALAARSEDLFLSVDCGTQSLKCALYDEELNLVLEDSVDYDADLSKYGTEGGMIFLNMNDQRVVRSPTLMWFEALDVCLLRLSSKVNLNQVRGISGAAQQHSSVFWHLFPESGLQGEFDASAGGLHQYLASGSLSVDLSPIWADSSTSDECRAAEDRVGGRSAMARLTGSVALERFTGNQIARMSRTDPCSMKSTSLIQLLSTAMSSVFAGRVAPADLSDAAGMNMLDLSRLEWIDNLSRVFSTEALRSKVGDLCPKSNKASATVVGSVCPFFQRRYGFASECLVIGFTGDNPASLAGAAGAPNDVIVSLGTSDTVLAQLEKRDAVDVSGGGISIFPHPLRPATDFMVMVCYKSGGFVRASEKTEERGWEDVDAALVSQPTGDDILLFNFPQGEIAPKPIAACLRAFKVATGQEVTDLGALTWRQRVRGVFLTRALAIKAHLGEMGTTVDRVVLTGGGSKSAAVQAVFEKVLGVPVVRLEESGSACRGAALRAILGSGLKLNEPNEGQFKSNTFDVSGLDLPKECSVEMYRSCEAQLFS